MRRFDITYFEGPGAEYIVKEEVVADIAKSGMTLCQLWFTYDVETNRKALKLLEKYELKGVVYEKRLLELFRSGNMEAVDSVVKAVVDDYKEFAHVITGWEIADEPNTEEYPILAAITTALRKYAPEQERVINLYPNYAPPEALKAENYIKYVEDYIEKVKPDFLSYDYYTFLGRQVQKEAMKNQIVEDEKERLIRAAADRASDRVEFFENIEDIRRLGMEHNIEQMMIVLLTEHGSYRNLTREEILWQVNMCLAYGMHRISYFTYWLPVPDEFWKWDNAMCNREGEKYQHYYDVQNINKEIYPIGKILFEHQSEEIFHIATGEKAVREFEGYGSITKIDGTRGVIGFFEDGYIYIVNHDYVEARTFKISTKEMLEQYEAGSFLPCEKEFEIILSPGAGKLFKIKD